jgi:hypothetical protein
MRKEWNSEHTVGGQDGGAASYHYSANKLAVFLVAHHFWLRWDLWRLTGGRNVMLCSVKFRISSFDFWLVV